MRHFSGTPPDFGHCATTTSKTFVMSHHHNCTLTQYIEGNEKLQHLSHVLHSYVYGEATLQERLLLPPCNIRNNKLNIKKQLQGIDQIMSPDVPVREKSVPPNAPRIKLFHSFDNEIYPNWASGKYGLPKRYPEAQNLIAIPAIWDALLRPFLGPSRLLNTWLSWCRSILFRARAPMGKAKIQPLRTTRFRPNHVPDLFLDSHIIPNPVSHLIHAHIIRLRT